MNHVIALMLSLGSLFLLVSLVPVTRIINHPGAKDIVHCWRLLAGLICLFLYGYIAYGWFYWWNKTALVDCIVPIIFFFGALFVLLVAVLARKTT